MRTESRERSRRVRPDPDHVPASTCRLQMSHSFTFRDAAKVVDYLDALGISDCYASPFLMARPGSLHGYDVTDHGKFNPEIGSDEDFREFARHLRGHGMGLIADVVPNHMCISDLSNRWWWDVLENGPYSLFSPYFDIDWNPPKPDLANKLLLPVLGEQYGRVLENQELAVRYDTSSFQVTYHETRLPLSPRSWALLLEPALIVVKRGIGDTHPSTVELESILTGLSHLPYGAEIEEPAVRELQREKEVLKQRLAKLVSAYEAIGQAIEDSIRKVNGTKGNARSFDGLERLLALQFYRLSFWRVAADEINYRRFFDINELAAIRVEDPAVFSAVHDLLFNLIKQGHISGLRVDHPDGLFDPTQYFRDLQAGCLAARPQTGIPGRLPFYVVCEKILIGDEELRGNWAIEGTTGYGFLNFLNGLFVDHSKRRAFYRLYQAFIGYSQPYEDLVYESKKLVLQVSMSSELNVLARELDRISEQHRWSRDFTLESLRSALLEIVACFPIYRTYITGGAPRPDAEDARHINSAIDRAKRRNRAISESVFDFIRDVLMHYDPEGLSEAQSAQRRHFVMRFQQFTGPVMAKGLEDTAFYRYFPLASLNEVGGDLRQFGVAPSVLHTKSLIRRRVWPNAMLATSTHDSKRSEDVRALINVLSEIPGDWYRAIRSWQEMNRKRKAVIAGADAPSANEEYLFYQTLIGAWPLQSMKSEEHLEFVNRIQVYMEKAVREAKVHSSWINPNSAHEAALRNFVGSALELPPDNQFLNAFVAFRRSIALAGMLNSLSQVLLKIASPGVADFYQGSELWNLTLVDPDNRRPIDFSIRRALLEKLDRVAQEDRAALVESLMKDPADGAIKLYITSRALRFRRTNRDLFAKGAYLPLRAVGNQQAHVIAFARVFGGRQAIALAGRFFMALGAKECLPVGEETWRNSDLMLRTELGCNEYQDVFTQLSVKTEIRNGKAVLPLRDVFSHLPLALLVGDKAG
jgi:(1->4)-alpha-D-glucan 1-alpha-D-glucosylmutase